MCSWRHTVIVLLENHQIKTVCHLSPLKDFHVVCVCHIQKDQKSTEILSALLDFGDLLSCET